MLDAESLTGHTVVCGWNRNVPRFLSALAKGHTRDVVLVNEASNDVVEPLLKSYATLRILFVRGSFSQESILASAGIKQAHSAVIMPDESAMTGETAGDEQKTVLATLIIKELAPHVKVYAHVRQREDAAPTRSGERRTMPVLKTCSRRPAVCGQPAAGAPARRAGTAGPATTTGLYESLAHTAITRTPATSRAARAFLITLIIPFSLLVGCNLRV